MSQQSMDVESLESVFAATDVLYACMDTDFNFIRVNRAYTESDDREPEFYVGKNHFDLFPYKDNEAVFRQVVETGESYSAKARAFEYTEHPQRGVSYWDWTLHPIKDDSGRVESVVLCLVNATERVKAEKKLALWENNNRRAFAGEVVEDDVEFPVKGKMCHYHNIITPIYQGEEIIGVQGMNIDVSEQRQAERLLRIQRDLALKLNTVRMLEDVLQVCTGAALEASGMDCGGIYLLDKGTGLGLAVSKSIIEKLGGTIDIKSEPGGGTTAIISLPTIPSR